MSKPVRVLVVDDSALMRQMLTTLLSSDPGIEVVGSAPDPHIARERIKALDPDVLTLDVEMPHMDGLAFLEKIMTLRPMPVLMVSSLTQKGAQAALRALELGAVDCIGKPTSDLRDGMEALRDQLISKVKMAAAAKVRPRTIGPAKPIMSKGHSWSTSEIIIAIGASTGGVEALHTVLQSLPADAPAILVTQHMPPAFTSSFAERLNRECALAISEARDGVRVLPGHAYIAPGGWHLELARSGADYRCRLHDGPSVSGHRPSVDVLFHSVARHAGANAVGVILTGMGRDGAHGLKEMRDAGARTIGQNEASCVVYGMPKAARDEGAVETEVGLTDVAGEILRRCSDVAPRRMRI